jgi:hypothetical protein
MKGTREFGSSLSQLWSDNRPKSGPDALAKKADRRGRAFLGKLVTTGTKQCLTLIGLLSEEIARIDCDECRGKGILAGQPCPACFATGTNDLEE